MVKDWLSVKVWTVHLSLQFPARFTSESDEVLKKKKRLDATLDQ